jgi:hypothetical protein
VIGIDQETGAVTSPQTRVALSDFQHDVIHGEWADGGDTLVFEATEAIGRRSLWRVPRTGGTPTRFHTFASDQIR